MVSPRMTIRYVLFVLAIPAIFVLAVLAVRILISQDDPAAVEEPSGTVVTAPGVDLHGRRVYEVICDLRPAS